MGAPRARGALRLMRVDAPLVGPLGTIARDQGLRDRIGVHIDRDARTAREIGVTKIGRAFAPRQGGITRRAALRRESACGTGGALASERRSRRLRRTRRDVQH